MADYQTTDVPYAVMSQTDIREPVLRGVGHAPLGPAADSYRSVADQLRRVGDSVADALKTAASAQAGDAADAAARHIASMIEPGDVGWAQAELAACALEDAADHHIRARQDMAAFPEPDFFTPGSERDRLHTSTILAGQRYQDNVNHGLSTTFQAFPPPAANEVGVQPAASVPGPAGGGRSGLVSGRVTTAGALANSSGPTDVVGPAGGGSTAGAGTPVVPGSTGGTALPSVGGAVSSTPGTGAGRSTGQGSATLPTDAGSAARPGVGPSPAGGSRTAAPGRTSTAPRSSGTPTIEPQSLPRTTPGGSPPPAGWPTRPPAGVLGGTVPPPSTDPVISGGVADGRWGSEQRGGSTWPGAGWKSGSGAGSSTGSGSGTSTGIGSGSGSGSGRRSSDVAEPVPRSQPGEPAASSRAAGATRPGQSGYGGMPMMGGGAGAGQEHERRRPPWLLEPDPEALWMGNLPPHTDPVIEPYEQDR